MSHTQTESIRESILDCVAGGPKGIARQVAEAYGISRQAVNRHLDALVDAGILEQDGHTRSKEYRLRRTALLNREVRVTPVLNPDRLWEDHIAVVLADDRARIRDLCRSAFGELIRNVTRHAEASWITILFATTSRHIDVTITDDGHGFFKRLASRFGVKSEREAAELMIRHANARSTDSPAAHLASLGRGFESFTISSGGISVAFTGNAWIVSEDEPAAGTRITLRARRTDTPRVGVPKRPAVAANR